MSLSKHPHSLVIAKDRLVAWIDERIDSLKQDMGDISCCCDDWDMGYFNGQVSTLEELKEEIESSPI